MRHDMSEPCQECPWIHPTNYTATNEDLRQELKLYETGNLEVPCLLSLGETHYQACPGASFFGCHGKRWRRGIDNKPKKVAKTSPVPAKNIPWFLRPIAEDVDIKARAGQNK